MEAISVHVGGLLGRCGLAALMAGVALARPAWTRAQDEARDESGSDQSASRASKPMRLSGEVAVTSRTGLRDHVWALSPLLAGSYRLLSKLDVEASWGGVMLLDVGADGNTATTFGSSNLALGARYWQRDSSTENFEVSLHVIAPLAWLGRDGLSGQRRAGFGLAAAMRGLWNPWLWAPEQMGGALGVRYGHQLIPLVRVQLEGGVGSTFTLGAGTADIAELYGQLAGEVIANAALVDFAWRLQSVWMTADRVAMQLAMAPSLAVHLSATTLRAQWLINLDPPLGIIGNGMGVWAVLLSLETRL